jgi:hypothetical protein
MAYLDRLLIEPAPSYPVATKLSNEGFKRLHVPLANNHREFMLDLRERV